MNRPTFRHVKEYAPRFTDADYWRPYVQVLCGRHGLAPCEAIRAGLPGSHPVFLVEGRWAVKLFSDLFGGPASLAVEHEAYRLLAAAPEVPAPVLLASGALFPMRRRRKPARPGAADLGAPRRLTAGCAPAIGDRPLPGLGTSDPSPILISVSFAGHNW